MNVVRWRPFREFDHFLQGGFPGESAPVRRADWLPLVDIRETEDNYQINVEVPAVASEDLSVSVTDGVLSVSGERKANDDDATDGRLHRVERRYGKFVRNFRLPQDADAESISAQSRDGVLYLTISKKAGAVARQIEVESSA